jgi:predicted enzyme related to lactoylglutathione lyase
MKILGLERVALEVNNMEQAIEFYSDLFQTSFIEKEFPQNKSTQLAFSELGVELIRESTTTEEKLRSFHLRVDRIEDVKQVVEQKGGKILAPVFEVGIMKHTVAQLGAIRIVFVEYEGRDSIGSLIDSEQ